MIANPGVRLDPAEHKLGRSSLVVELSAPFYTSPTRSGAEPFLESISAAAVRRYLSAENFSFHVSKANGQLAGVVVPRDNNHLFHLFVAEPYQRIHVASRLWSIVELETLAADNPGEFTVNSSLNAVPVYEKFSFSRVGEIQYVNGICFQPMRLKGGSKEIQSTGSHGCLA